MIPREWDVLPLWVQHMEALSPEAIALVADADRRPRDIPETMLVRLNRLPYSGGQD